MRGAPVLADQPIAWSDASMSTLMFSRQSGLEAASEVLELELDEVGPVRWPIPAVEIDMMYLDLSPASHTSRNAGRVQPPSPQGVILPWVLWLEILPAIEDRLDAAGDERVSFEEAAEAVGRDPRRDR